MGKEIHLSAVAAVRRTPKGDTLSINLQTNGVPLFQGLNPDTFTVSPKWSEDGTHPVITPTVGSARKNNVTLTNHAWAYNGKDLGFGFSGTGWETSTVDGRFKLNHADGSLAIIADLASKVNQDSDTLTYSGDAVMGASIYPMSKSIDILVSMLGGSSYFGGVSADTTVLNRDRRKQFSNLGCSTPQVERFLLIQLIYIVAAEQTLQVLTIIRQAESLFTETRQEIRISSM